MHKGKQFLLSTDGTSPAVSPGESSHWEFEESLLKSEMTVFFIRERHKRLNHMANRSVQVRITQNLPFCWLLPSLAATFACPPLCGPGAIAPPVHCKISTQHSVAQGANTPVPHILSRRKRLIPLADCGHRRCLKMKYCIGEYYHFSTLCLYSDYPWHEYCCSCCTEHRQELSYSSNLPQGGS